MRLLLLMTALLGCRSTAEPRPASEPAEPAELGALVAAADALCACADAACAEPAYEKVSAAVGERDLAGWTEAQRSRFHAARWRAEDCNLALLAGGDEEVLEHAREALRDRFAAAAPLLLAQVYQRALELHAGGAALPPSSTAPTPAPGSCCRWSDGLCPPEAASWQKPPWAALGFAVDQRQPYALSYRRSAETEVLVTAVGDIDCDGSYGTFELRGDVGRQDPGEIRLTDHLE